MPVTILGLLKALGREVSLAPITIYGAGENATLTFF